MGYRAWYIGMTREAYHKTTPTLALEIQFHQRNPRVIIAEELSVVY